MSTNLESPPIVRTAGKAIATIGLVLMLLAGLGTVIIAGALLAADQIRTAFGVDLIQWGLIASGISTGLFAIGKGIRDYGAMVAAGGLPAGVGDLGDGGFTPPTAPGGTGVSLPPGDFTPPAEGDAPPAG